MERGAYLALLRDLLSGDAERMRQANRVMYGLLVGGDPLQAARMVREADLVLAEAPSA